MGAKEVQIGDKIVQPHPQFNCELWMSQNTYETQARHIIKIQKKNIRYET